MRWQKNQRQFYMVNNEHVHTDLYVVFLIVYILSPIDFVAVKSLSFVFLNAFICIRTIAHQVFLSLPIYKMHTHQIETKTTHDFNMYATWLNQSV